MNLVKCRLRIMHMLSIWLLLCGLFCHVSKMYIFCVGILTRVYSNAEVEISGRGAIFIWSVPMVFFAVL